MLFLRHAKKLLERAGFAIVNLDVVVLIERPKILPFRARIRENLARALGAPVGAVSVKAKTAEGLGPVGQGKAAEAYATIIGCASPDAALGNTCPRGESSPLPARADARRGSTPRTSPA